MGIPEVLAGLISAAAACSFDVAMPDAKGPAVVIGVSAMSPMPSLTVELRLPDDQLKALASLIAKNVGEGSGRATYTVAQAARKTGQSEKTIRRHIEAGRLARVPHIHKTLIPASALERYING